MARRLLTDFELMILLAILRVGDDAYGVRIAREIEETAGRSAQIAAIYAALDRMESRGLVGSALGEPTPERGGRAKRRRRTVLRRPEPGSCEDRLRFICVEIASLVRLSRSPATEPCWRGR